MTRAMLLPFLLIGCLTQFCVAQTLPVFTEPSPPYHYLDHSGQVAGSSTDKVKAILASADIEADFKLVPWARAYRSVEKTPNALIYSIAKTAERDAKFHWIAPVSEFKLAFVALAERTDIDIPDWTYLRQLSVAVQRDDIAYNWLTSIGLKEGVHFIACADIQCSWERLARKNVDLIIEDPALIPMMRKQLSMPDIRLRSVAYIPELEVIGYLAANKDMDAEIVARLKRATYKGAED